MELKDSLKHMSAEAKRKIYDSIKRQFGYKDDRGPRKLLEKLGVLKEKDIQKLCKAYLGYKQSQGHSKFPFEIVDEYSEEPVKWVEYRKLLDRFDVIYDNFTVVTNGIHVYVITDRMEAVDLSRFFKVKWFYE
ncbi:MAG: hypothetical protein D6710_12510 [Nitrospirae bacterium]|nr:MAG: hypothetical protein D6710_12510 [Nitrospirota bacterium]